ncbi:SDR family NAD(P)-dependent oxidoreductase [Bacillus sp. HMF5848]|uniref:SDR family NAD(P)-dependent oxidoreductase n=1 Tax=Bacillus sp. HMF5848 TaxID=2495421 RepID=UPI000F784DA7|nr:SDR family NAD(P)-dependent oxidoreductase [Bacillus sp. HMF5848]RSK29324.1 SDR family NAD(P)-dependent oxidoreductase [Bacillus sp. HMF5848]
MSKALVIGASGGMGYALVKELISRGVEVVAFAKSEQKLTSLYKHEAKIKIATGDALIVQDLLKAAEGVDVIFNAISFPYQEWKEKHPRCVDNIISVALNCNAKIAHVDNIYAYGKQAKRRVSESATKEPHTKKGKIRLTLEEKLLNSPVPSLIVHFPDLYGPNANNTILHETLKSVANQKNSRFVGKLDVRREFLYTLDGAKAMVELALRQHTYDQNWNIPASHPITGEELISLFRDEIGYKGKIQTVSKGMIQLLALFSSGMREFLEMMYLTESPVILNGDKYEANIGNIPKTPYKEGLKQTLAWMKSAS